MSDTEWSLGGTIGQPIPPPDLESLRPQKMLQGIGFPLRDVRGVPPNDTGEVFNPDTIAQGFQMVWCDEWDSSKAYLTGYVVSDGIWVMIANKLNQSQPFPVVDGNPTFGIPSFTPVTQNNNSVVYSGHVYTFTEPVVLRQIRIWVTQLTADTNYRVVGLFNYPGVEDPTSVIIEEPVLQEDIWNTIAFPNTLIPTGTELLIYIDALNSGSDTPVLGGWTYNGVNNTGAPAAQGWNRDQQQLNVRIDKTDLDGTDRTSELLGMIAGTTIQFAQTNAPSEFFEYRVTGAPIDSGTFVQYPVTLTNTSGTGPDAGTTTTMTAAVPIAQPTEYAEENTPPNPPWANAIGFLQFNGVDQPVAQNRTYGVDLQCEPAVFSEDWDVFSYNTP